LEAQLKEAEDYQRLSKGKETAAVENAAIEEAESEAYKDVKESEDEKESDDEEESEDEKESEDEEEPFLFIS
jgi:hypothetical protein